MSSSILCYNQTLFRWILWFYSTHEQEQMVSRKSALALLSGGLDSATVLAWVQRQGYFSVSDGGRLIPVVQKSRKKSGGK
jgi:asparagine synthase